MHQPNVNMKGSIVDSEELTANTQLNGSFYKASTLKLPKGSRGSKKTVPLQLTMNADKTFTNQSQMKSIQPYFEDASQKAFPSPALSKGYSEWLPKTTTPHKEREMRINDDLATGDLTKRSSIMNVNKEGPSKPAIAAS